MFSLFLLLLYYSYIAYLYFCRVCGCVCVRACTQSLSHVPLFVTTWTVAHQSPLSTEFFRQEYQNMFLFSTPGIFPTQGSNLGFLHLLHWQADPLRLRHLGSPDIEVPHCIFLSRSTSICNSFYFYVFGCCVVWDFITFIFFVNYDFYHCIINPKQKNLLFKLKHND